MARRPAVGTAMEPARGVPALIEHHTEGGNRTGDSAGCHIVALSVLLPATADPLWFECAAWESRCNQISPEMGTPADLLGQVDREFAEFAPVLKVAAPRVAGGKPPRGPGSDLGRNRGAGASRRPTVHPAKRANFDGRGRDCYLGLSNCPAIIDLRAMAGKPFLVERSVEFPAFSSLALRS